MTMRNISYHQIARDTLNTLENGYYKLSNGKTVSIQNSIDHCVEETILYRSQELDVLLSKLQNEHTYDTVIEVTNETTLSAGERLTQTFDSVCCLNFGSAIHPGGVFWNGNNAQEQSLARASALYPSLVSKIEMYEYNKAHKDYWYCDNMILSPSVPVFKNDNGEYREKPYHLSFLTCPAVHKSVLQRQTDMFSQEKVDTIMQKRIKKIVGVALKHKYEALILGSYGCGIFGNNPNDVARYFAGVLSSFPYKHGFKQITFAVYDNAHGTPTYEAFRNTFQHIEAR